jgi:hypothetical protein
MKTISKLFALSSLAFICTSAQAAGSGPEGAPKRGTVLVAGPSVKAVVVGPVAIHAYSAFSGGAIYTAPAITGTDSDCQAHAGASASTDLRADRVTTFTVGAGQVACLATNTTKSFELLWHTQKDVPSPALVMVAGN